MNDSDAAAMGTGRREVETDLCARMVRLERANGRLRFGLVGVGVLVVGIALGGFAQSSTDPIVGFTMSDETMYRIYESGRIEYLRIEGSVPHTDKGLFGWGEVKIDERHELADRP